MPAALVLAVTSAAPAFAGDEQPYGTQIVAASDWLEAAGVVNKGGVAVYSNGNHDYVSGDYNAPAVGMRWQCVELVQRLYYAEGWTNPSNKIFGVNASGIYNLGDHNFTSFPNDGRYVPVPGDLIVHSGGTGGTGHVAVVNYVSGNKVYVIEQNVATSAEFANGQASYTIGSNLALTRDQAITNSPIEGIVHSGYNNNTDPGYTYPNGTVLHDLGTGAIYVWAGGAKFQFGSLTELSDLGYSTNYPGMKDLSSSSASAIPNTPADGAVLRSRSGTIYVVAGGAKFPFSSWGEYTGQGYGTSSYTTVPQAPLNAIGDAPSNMPRNGTVVLHPNGTLYVIAGGVRWPFSSMDQFHSLGYSTYVPVSAAPLNGIYDASASHLPANGTLLQGSSGTVYVMQNGLLMAFISAQQFTNYGYSWSNIVRVPDNILSAIPSGGNLP